MVLMFSVHHLFTNADLSEWQKAPPMITEALETKRLIEKEQKSLKLLLPGVQRPNSSIDKWSVIIVSSSPRASMWSPLPRQTPRPPSIVCTLPVQI